MGGDSCKTTGMLERYPSTEEKPAAGDLSKLFPKIGLGSATGVDNSTLSMFDCAGVNMFVTLTIQVVFLIFDYFNTQTGSDFLYIYDGSNSAVYPLLDTLHGSYSPVPGPYSSTQRYMFLRFTSDASTNSAGFSATYKSTLYRACLAYQSAVLRIAETCREKDITYT